MIESKYKISLVISLYNEAKSFTKLMNEISSLKTFIKIDEIILVNNGSTDNTLVLLKNNSKIYKYKYINVLNSQGYGDGFMTGIKAASGDYIITNHADCQYSFNVLKKFLNNNNLISNSISIFPKRIKRNFISVIRSLLVKIVCSLILNKFIPDVNGQPKFFPKKAIYEEKNWPTGFAFDLFLFIKLSNSKINILHPEVFENKRSAGVSSWNFSFKNQISFFLIYIKDCIKIKKIISN